MKYNEVEKRNETFLEAVKHLIAARDKAMELPEYCENMAIIHELNDMLDNVKTRLLSHAKTCDKGMMTRIHQIDALLGGGRN